MAYRTAIMEGIITGSNAERPAFLKIRNELSPGNTFPAERSWLKTMVKSSISMAAWIRDPIECNWVNTFRWNRSKRQSRRMAYAVVKDPVSVGQVGRWVGQSVPEIIRWEEEYGRALH